MVRSGGCCNRQPYAPGTSSTKDGAAQLLGARSIQKLVTQRAYLIPRRACGQLRHAPGLGSRTPRIELISSPLVAFGVGTRWTAGPKTRHSRFSKHAVEAGRRHVQN
ncbi:hypothetical protein D1O30_17160 [Methylocystis hirsuta]|uniref:Uncharacterized protein n=1 Tax=Methylocystis hirsuta TaxID=369798 RepID=A0A3M9XTV1_9HYPH|nr:hypothetical protein D1O30_17160 [Methylocystis hirsuta]